MDPSARPSAQTIAWALNRYAESQSGFTILSESARHAVLEIGDRMLGIQAALNAAGLDRRQDLGTEPAFESVIVSNLRDAIDPYLGLLTREIGFTTPATWRLASRYFHERFGALVDLSPITARCFHKPRGYAGDFEMMNMAYHNESLGKTLFGRSLSRVILDSDAGRAVRNRAHYLMNNITTAVTRGGRQRPTRILSVAAGPAMELQMILRNDPALLAAGRTEIALIDQDGDALEHAREQIQALAADAGVEVTISCITTSIRTVIAEGLGDSYDLIYSAGLFDYLTDWPARTAGARLVEALAPGGHAVIGNFDVVNPTRPFMELILDWPLYHRSTDDLRKLFADLGSTMTIEREAVGVNLFAVIGA